jgi:hypothetical protein
MLRLAKRRLTPVVVLLLVCSGWAVADPVTVSATVTPNGASFDYDYTVTNLTGFDLPVLDIVVRAGTTISSLSAPAGFLSAYDSGLGLVSFLEDSNVFGSIPLSGFMFDSPVPPGPTTFTANLLDANANLITSSGPTTGPAVVPEPGFAPLLAIGTGLLLLVHRKRASRCLPDL